jgi:hypothetical protein
VLLAGVVDHLEPVGLPLDLGTCERFLAAGEAGPVRDDRGELVQGRTQRDAHRCHAFGRRSYEPAGGADSCRLVSLTVYRSTLVRAVDEHCS